MSSGIGILLDLYRKTPASYTTNTALFSATLAASSAAASVFGSDGSGNRRRNFGFFRGNGGISVAYADAGSEWATEDYIPSLQIPTNLYKNDAFVYGVKTYPIELKPLLSALEPRTFAMTTVRSLLMFYLPLLEPHSNKEEDDDFLEDNPEEQHTDLVIPLKQSVKQIIRETTVVTTRRVLERVSVHYVSQHMAWKLLKDVSASARRKSMRGMPSVSYFCSVTRTTFRGHLLGIVASWLVQVGIDIYQSFSYLFKNRDEVDEVVTEEQLKVLGRNISRVTVRCSASIVFASIGAGIGATLFHPSYGQWIGCAIGDFVGPTAVFYCLGKL